MRRTLLNLLWLASLALTGCRASAAREAQDSRLRVVATFSVIGDLVRQVGGEHIELTTLVGPGTDTHTFIPTPSEGAALARAHLIFENGLEFETWLDDLYAASGSQAHRIVVSAGIQPIQSGSEVDPHIWHTAANAVQMVRNIREALIMADPDNAASFQKSGDAYIAELEDLDARIFAQAGQLPADRRKLVTTHDTFGYFAQRYGFVVVGTVLPTTTEGASPSAGQLAALIESIKAEGVPAVFAENVGSNALLTQAAGEAGVALVASLYTDALGPPGSEADTYLKMIQYNVRTMVSALSG